MKISNFVFNLNSKKKFVKIQSFLIFSIFFLITFLFQNCSKSSFSPSSQNLESKKYSSLSVSDSQILEYSEKSLNTAKLNVFDFIRILNDFEKLSKTLTSNQGDLSQLQNELALDNTSNMTSQEYLTNLTVFTNVFSRVLVVLQGIPFLDVNRRTYLNSAIGDLRSLINKRPDLMVIKAICLLIELKNTLLDEITALKSSQFTNEEKAEIAQTYLNKTNSLLEEIYDSMVIARPSNSADIKNFKNGFAQLIAIIIDGLRLSNSPVPVEIINQVSQIPVNN